MQRVASCSDLVCLFAVAVKLNGDFACPFEAVFVGFESQTIMRALALHSHSAEGVQLGVVLIIEDDLNDSAAFPAARCLQDGIDDLVDQSKRQLFAHSLSIKFYS